MTSAVTIDQLATATSKEFAFLEKLGFGLVGSREFAPESFKGGFELTYSNSAGDSVAILYSDNELEVRLNHWEVFGASRHEQFAGNMFSREHLLDALPKLKSSCETTMRSSLTTAT